MLYLQAVEEDPGQLLGAEVDDGLGQRQLGVERGDDVHVARGRRRDADLWKPGSTTSETTGRQAGREGEVVRLGMPCLVSAVSAMWGWDDDDSAWVFGHFLYYSRGSGL